MRKIAEYSVVVKIFVSLLGVSLALGPLAVVYLSGWAEFKLTVPGLLVALFLGMFIIAMIGEIFGLEWLKRELSSIEQDQEFIEKLERFKNPVAYFTWLILIVWGAYLVYEIWGKKSGI